MRTYVRNLPVVSEFHHVNSVYVSVYHKLNVDGMDTSVKFRIAVAIADRDCDLKQASFTRLLLSVMKVSSIRTLAFTSCSEELHSVAVSDIHEHHRTCGADGRVFGKSLFHWGGMRRKI